MTKFNRKTKIATGIGILLLTVVAPSIYHYLKQKTTDCYMKMKANVSRIQMLFATRLHKAASIFAASTG